MGRILDVTDDLRICVRDEFAPFEGICRLNDMGEYVSEEYWLNVRVSHPSWWPRALMPADNGQHTSDEVSRISVDEVEAAYSDPGFYPGYAFYTEASENGML